MVKFNFGLFNIDVKNIFEGIYLTCQGKNWNWRHLWFYAIIYVSFSCQENKTKQDSQVNRYSVDTVLIDSKNRILDLRGNLRHLSLDDSRKSFFLLNHFDLSIDEIDLDRHMFVKSYPLEAEGPNGVGDFIRSLQSVNDSLFFIKSNTGSSLIDKRGQFVKRIIWEDARDSNGSELMQFIREKEVLSGTNYLKLFGVNSDHKNGNVFLDVFSVSDNKINRFDIDPENSYHDFILKWDDNIFPPGVELSSEKNFILISHEYSNEMILFNLEGEFVKVVQYEPQKTPRRAKIPSGPEINARDQAGKDYQRILEQVRFESPVWDSVKKRFLRLSSKKIFTETYIDNNFVPEINKTRVFLSIFDAEFNLITEVEIGELNNERVKYFAKDGKLWICQNFSDELGFIVIDI